MGTGPFVLEEAVQDERLEYTKREGYDWAPAAFERTGEAALDRLTVQIVPEESVRAAGVVAGDHDLAYSITETGLSQAEGQEGWRASWHPTAAW
ncbi:ABC transporter substrate-binding protein [Nocardiopsis composta]